MLSPAFLGAINSKIESGEAVIKQIINGTIVQNNESSNVTLDSAIDLTKTIPILIQHGEDTINAALSGAGPCNMTTRFISNSILQSRRGRSGGSFGNPLNYTVLIVEFPDAISAQGIETSNSLSTVSISTVNTSNRVVVLSTCRAGSSNVYQSGIKARGIVTSPTQLTVDSGGSTGTVVYYILELPNL